MKHWRRHVFLYKVIRWILYPFTGLMYGLKSEKAPDLKEACIILSNHTMDIDPIILSRSFPRHLYFLASEHIFSWGWKSRVIEWVAAPVSKMKGNTDTIAVKEILRRVKKGHSICIFAEGNRSFTGVTKPIVASTGKLVKACRTTLVTYRFEGGYFSSPRWSSKSRRGKMKAYVVGVYPYKEIESLSDLEINQLIQRDLHEDAYLRQEKEPIAFKGRNLAEWLELSLYMCPLCEAIGSMKSRGNEFFCNNCGMSSTIDEYGYFHSKEMSFKTLPEWDAWQNSKIEELAKYTGEDIVFSDIHQRLFLIDPLSHERKELAKGTLVMYKDRLIIENNIFYFKDIVDLNVHGKMSLIFYSQGKSYEITSAIHRSARKYVSYHQHIAGNGNVKNI